ncbi:MAG: ImmA/IrrE family metallo-endopeptidase [Alphaproteobacteria bacterium]|nr:ImmA/IrrE family metallo-endopeptidase [Alphaproteobacteria bacterium]
MAPRIKARIKPELLVWARDSARFAVSEAATKLKIDEEKLASWENGSDAPSIPQLRNMASLYKRPLAVFYLQEVPTNFQVIRDLRRLPGSGFRRLPPTLLLELRRANQRRELALELLDDLGDKPSSFSLMASQDENPEVVGSRIRAALGVTDQEQSRWRDGEGRVSFNAWRGKIEDVGVLVFQATGFAAEEASGFAIAHELLPLIVVNQKDSYTRRSFSLLHEFAHLMLRVSGVSNLLDADDSRPPEDQAVEVFCNHVAAATLMPMDWLLSDERVAKHGSRAVWTDSDIADLARGFGVSREAVLRRLLIFERTTEAFYRQKREQYQAEFIAQRQKKNENAPEDGIPRNMSRETISNLGRPLIRMILGNYYQDRLTLSDVAGYLGIKTKHIPKVEQAVGFR